MNLALHLILTASFAAYQLSAFDGTKLLCLVNAERAKANVNPLAFCDKLVSAAQDHSNDQQNRGVMSHDPDLTTRIDGYAYTSIGENVAEGQQDEDSVMQSWMNSDGHRANILCPDFVHFGGGRAGDYWTQIFGAGESGGTFPDCSAYGGSSGGSAGNKIQASSGSNSQQINMDRMSSGSANVAGDSEGSASKSQQNDRSMKKSKQNSGKMGGKKRHGQKSSNNNEATEQQSNNAGDHQDTYSGQLGETTEQQPKRTKHGRKSSNGQSDEAAGQQSGSGKHRHNAYSTQPNQATEQQSNNAGDRQNAYTGQLGETTEQQPKRMKHGRKSSNGQSDETAEQQSGSGKHRHNAYSTQPNQATEQQSNNGGRRRRGQYQETN